MGGISRVLVEAEQIGIREVGLNGRMHTSIVDVAEENADGLVNVGAVLLHKADEDVNRIHEVAIGTTSVLAPDGGDDVPWNFPKRLLISNVGGSGCITTS